MNRWVRLTIWIAVLCVPLVVAVVLGRNALVAAATARLVKGATGLDLRFERVEAHLWRPSLHFRGVTVCNPPGFPAGDAVRIEEFYVEYDRRTLFGGPAHLVEIRLDLPRLVIVRNENGESNFGRLGEIMQRRQKEIERRRRPRGPPPVSPPRTGPDASAAPAPDAPVGVETTSVAATEAEAGVGAANGAGSGAEEVGTDPTAAMTNGPATPAPPAEPDYRIDRLTVKVGTIEMQTLRGGGRPPEVRTMELKVGHTVQDVTDIQAAAQEIGIAFLIQAAPVLMDEAERLMGESGAGGAGDGADTEQLERTLKQIRRNLE